MTSSKDYVAHLARLSKVYHTRSRQNIYLDWLFHCILHGDQNYLLTALISILDFNDPISWLQQCRLLNQNPTLIYQSHDQLLSIIVF